MSHTRRLAAILAADVAGYSRLMGADEEGTLERLKALRRELLDPKIASHHGRIVKTTGDGLLVEFASVVDAVRCAVEVQQAMPGRNTGVAADNRIELRIGINLGDVIVEGDDLYGDGVNIAARIEAFADAGGVFVSNTVHDHVRDRLPFLFEDLGEQQVKNIARPVRVYRVRDPAKSPLAPALPLPDKPSIAVLPFANMSGDPEQEYFADGMVEEIITELSRIRWLFVIARNSSFTYKGQNVDVKLVGRELGVLYVPPEISTTWPSPALTRAHPRSSRLISSSRPTSGPSNDPRNASNRLVTTLGRNTCQASTGSVMPLTSTGPISRYSKKSPASRRVRAAITTASGSAKACKRAARFGVSPTTDCSWVDPPLIISPTTTNPVAIPTRVWSLTDLTSRRATASMARSPARTARSASSSCACG
jgi:class 3 adenylate cyclase